MDASKEVDLAEGSLQPNTEEAAGCRESLHLSRQLALTVLKHGKESILYIAREITYVLESAFRGLSALWAKHSAMLHLWPASAVAALKILLQRLLASTAMQKIISIVAQLASLNITVSTNDDLTDSASKVSARISTYLSLLFGAIR